MNNNVAVTKPCREIRKEARFILKGNWGKSALAMLLCFAVVFIPMIIFILILGEETGETIANLYFNIIIGPLALGIAAYFLKLYRNEEAMLTDIFKGFERFGKALFLYFMISLFVLLWALPAIIAMAICVAAFFSSSAALALIGSILFIAFLPLPIIAKLRYSQSFICFADNPKIGVFEAINESKRLMKNNIGKFFLLNLSFIGWFLLSAVTLGISAIWIIPYFCMACVVFYSLIAGRDAAAEEDAPEDGGNPDILQSNHENPKEPDDNALIYDAPEEEPAGDNTEKRE